MEFLPLSHDVPPRETSPAAKSEEKRMFSQASLIVGRKFNVFGLFYFVFERNFRVQAPGGLIYIFGRAS